MSRAIVTWVVLIEISVLCSNLTSGQSNMDHFNKTWLSLKGISCLHVIFVLIWMKQTLIWFNLQTDGTGNELSNDKNTFVKSLQLRMSVLHQSICIFKAGLSSLYDGWAKYKEKVPDLSDPNQNVKTTCNSSLYNVKIYSSKGCRKSSPRWINICS